MRNIIEKLGPTYVKVAQSLSTRVDILSAKYFAEIELLQDRVPPFSSKEAYELIELELGRKVEDIFEQLTETTVASASLGQVYRGVLRKEYGGGEVAVKVQRPNVLSQVALDLYVARLLAIYVFPKVQRVSLLFDRTSELKVDCCRQARIIWDWSMSTLFDSSRKWTMNRKRRTEFYSENKWHRLKASLSQSSTRT